MGDTEQQLSKTAMAKELFTEFFTKPKSAPVSYVRCSACGRVAPSPSIRRITGVADGRLRDLAPPELVCQLCGEASPFAVSDEINPADPDVETVELVCRTRFGMLLFWRRCRTVIIAPAAAAVVQCPACRAGYPVPGA